MIISSKYNSKKVSIDLSNPIDISIPINPNNGVNAFFIPEASYEPLQVGNFIGSVKLGGSANCENIHINAHGNGTHTECVGHISKVRVCINDVLKDFHFFAQLISVVPEKFDDDYVITMESLSDFIYHTDCEAIIIRTLPNDPSKKRMNYSGKNPTYIHHTVCKHLREIGIKHLLIDLPSVDREEDEGELLAHKSFWNYPVAPEMKMTITELIYVPEEIKDGTYFLNIQISSLMTDASPSKPVLYNIIHE